MQLLAQERSRVLYYAEILFAVHQHLFTGGVHAGLIAAAGGKLFQRSLPQLRGGLVPRERRDPTDLRLLQLHGIG